ncbi:small-conductance mechanosensitive channel [Salinibacter ruber]|nr:small-conductance mechanosensitive channel [Salinibacter ruber]MCS4193026.1 small-conductance mechanosensitive channel [Salinibacter ruber]
MIDLLLQLGAPQAWLDSPGLQVLLLGAVRIVIILALAALVLALVRRGTERWIATVADRPATDPKRQRAVTLGTLLQSTAGYVVWAVAGIMVLSEVGLDIGALIATAGIAGLAVGFGAQTLVKDVIGGIFLLFDDILHVGDLVTIDGHTGTIEEIGVRLIKLRKFDGELVMIPAGEVRTFGNKSVQWARAIVPVGLSYEQDVDAILPVMERVANEWVAAHEEIVLDETPQVQGLMDFGDSSVTARVVVRVTPGEQYAAERELRQRLKRAFDAKGIEIPFPQRTMHVARREAPARPLGQATHQILPRPRNRTRTNNPHARPLRLVAVEDLPHRTPTALDGAGARWHFARGGGGRNFWPPRPQRRGENDPRQDSARARPPLRRHRPPLRPARRHPGRPPPDRVRPREPPLSGVLHGHPDASRLRAPGRRAPGQAQ